MREFVCKKSGEFEHVPCGVYKGQFEGAEDFKVPSSGDDTLKWMFVVTDGEHAGQKIDALTDPFVTDKNKCGRFMAGLYGQKPAAGTVYRPDEFIGKTYQIVVGMNKSSKETINSFTPIA